MMKTQMVADHTTQMTAERKTQMVADRKTLMVAERKTQMVADHLRVNQRSSAFKGQGTLEYAVVLAAVSAALLAMQIYAKRGISGELRRAADSTGEQYDPRNTTGKITLGSLSDTTTTSTTLNEPDMKALLKAECLAEGRSSAECEVIACKDFSDPPNGNCTDVRVFGTRSRSILKKETTTRTGDETVGPLGTNLWQ